MMNNRDIVTLSDGNKYVVVASTCYENKDYYYLLDLNENSNYKFCYKVDSDIIEVDDKDLILKLIPLMLKSYNIDLQ